MSSSLCEEKPLPKPTLSIQDLEILYSSRWALLELQKKTWAKNIFIRCQYLMAILIVKLLIHQKHPTLGPVVPLAMYRCREVYPDKSMTKVFSWHLVASWARLSVTTWSSPDWNGPGRSPLLIAPTFPPIAGKSPAERANHPKSPHLSTQRPPPGPAFTCHGPFQPFNWALYEPTHKIGAPDAQHTDKLGQLTNFVYDSRPLGPTLTMIFQPINFSCHPKMWQNMAICLCCIVI